jgi:hypothetical protein
MNNRTVLLRLDSERQTVADADVTLEITPHVVRAIGKEASWSGIVYSRFSAQEAAAVINCEIGYFANLNRAFEWKVYSHDEPSDLLDRLRSCGFKIGEEDALMILDLQELPAALRAPAPEGVIVRPVYMLIGVHADLAFQESSKKSERIGSAWQAKKGRAVDGKALTAQVPQWLKAEKGKPVTIIGERAETVRKIFQLAALGLGNTRIIRKLMADGDRPFLRGKMGVNWTPSYITKLLSARSVLGEYQRHKYINGKRIPVGDPLPDFFPSVISYTEWEAARATIDAKTCGNRAGRGGTRGELATNLFTGLVKDVTAGRNLNFHSKSKINPPYLVTAYSSTDRTSNRIRYDKFETAFLGFLSELDWKSVAGWGSDN